MSVIYSGPTTRLRTLVEHQPQNKHWTLKLYGITFTMYEVSLHASQRHGYDSRDPLESFQKCGAQSLEGRFTPCTLICLQDLTTDNCTALPEKFPRSPIAHVYSRTTSPIASTQLHATRPWLPFLVLVRITAWNLREEGGIRSTSPLSHKP